MKRHRSRAFSAGILAMAMAVAGLFPAQQAQAVQASGGTVTTSGDYTIHTFTSSGTFTVNTGGDVEVLVVAGGGGAGSNAAGGGGAGGCIYNNAFHVAAGSYTVTVGVGGNAGYWVGATSMQATSGGNSVFSTLTAVGGGYGASRDTGGSGGSGGSGGGGAGTGADGGASAAAGRNLPGSGTAGQGNSGGAGHNNEHAGQSGGGGGGYASAGGAGAESVGGDGGNGFWTDISGTLTGYCGGGAGGSALNKGTGFVQVGAGGGGGREADASIHGRANSGGGGGCIWASGATGNGGSGIVIVRYSGSGLPPPANNPPTVSITAPSSGATYTAPATVNITASASDTDGTIARVEFYQGTTKLGEDTDSSGGWTHSWTGVAAGSYSLTAKAFDNGGASTISAAVGITVTGDQPATPTIVNAAASGVTASSATLNGNLTSAGTASTTVYVYWGTVDRGQTTSGWEGSQNLGVRSPGAVSHPVSGLAQGATYYYRFYASNSAGVAWADPAASFGTLSALVVDNDGGATNITSGGARLRGALTAGGSASVTVYWGPTDGGTTPGSWANTVPIGPVSVNDGPFSTDISGLTETTTYFYRSYAQNAGETDWADSTASFVTIQGGGITDNDGDGMDDGWETTYLGGTNAALGGAMEDRDGDGFSNLHEYIAGTDPTNAASVLKVGQVSPGAATNFVLDWASVAGKVYSVKWIANLMTPPWQTVASDITATPPMNVYTGSVTGVGSGFYRVEVQQ